MQLKPSIEGGFGEIKSKLNFFTVEYALARKMFTGFDTDTTQDKS